VMVDFILDNGKMIKWMDMVHFIILQGNWHTKANGQMDNFKEKECYLMKIQLTQKLSIMKN
jgi:hypothetical protein